MIELRSKLAELAGRSGLKIASVGTHPFSHWRDQLITEGERYQEIVKDMQQLARANLIFGLHVHVGIPDREAAIHVMNQARYFLPHIYALSVNSPFWVGQDTGLKGYRLKVFERFPRTGIPDAFESLSEYEDYCKLLVKTGCIDNAEENLVGHSAASILRHARSARVRCAIARGRHARDRGVDSGGDREAVTSCSAQNTTFRVYRRRLLDENRWRASRYGIDGKLIDFGREAEVETRSLLNELLEFVSTRSRRARQQTRNGAHRADHARRHRRGSTTGDWQRDPRHESRGRSNRGRNLPRFERRGCGPKLITDLVFGMREG